MNLYCIADEDTVRGFRLAGLDGEAVETPEQTVSAVLRAAARDDVGILIVTDVAAAEARTEIDVIRLENRRPLIVEIPGPEGPMPGRKTLRQFVSEAVGFRIGQDEDY